MIRKMVLAVDGEVGIGAEVGVGVGVEVAVGVGVGMGAPVNGVVLQEARRMPHMIARTIHRW